MIFNSYKWFGNRFSKTGLSISILFAFIVFYLYMIDLKSFSSESPAKIMAN